VSRQRALIRPWIAVGWKPAASIEVHERGPGSRHADSLLPLQPAPFLALAVGRGAARAQRMSEWEWEWECGPKARKGVRKRARRVRRKRFVTVAGSGYVPFTTYLGPSWSFTTTTTHLSRTAPCDTLRDA